VAGDGGDGGVTFVRPKKKNPKVHLPVVPAVSAGEAGPPLPKPPGYDPYHPPLECSVCTINSTCPEYKEGDVCAFNETFRGLDTRNADEVEGMVHVLLKDTFERYQRAKLQERFAGGGFIDPRVTAIKNDLFNMAKAVQEWRQQTQTISVEVKATGSAATKAVGSGLMAKMFGVAPPPPKEEDVIPAVATVLPAEKEVSGEAVQGVGGDPR
jgi:hypothetical protein